MLFLFRSAPEVEKRIHSKLFRRFWRSRGTKEPAYITVYCWANISKLSGTNAVFVNKTTPKFWFHRMLTVTTYFPSVLDSFKIFAHFYFFCFHYVDTDRKRDIHITRFHFVWRIHTEIQLVFQVFKARVKIIVWLFLYDFSMGDAKENHQRAFHWIEQILLSLEVHLQTLIWSGVVSALSLNWTKWGSLWHFDSARSKVTVIFALPLMM